MRNYYLSICRYLIITRIISQYNNFDQRTRKSILSRTQQPTYTNVVHDYEKERKEIFQENRKLKSKN